MIKLKSREEQIYCAFMICLVSECEEEATKFWSTETNLIDVCDKHYKQLEMQRYIT